jgi:hypothetical protein
LRPDTRQTWGGLAEPIDSTERVLKHPSTGTLPLSSGSTTRSRRHRRPHQVPRVPQSIVCSVPLLLDDLHRLHDVLSTHQINSEASSGSIGAGSKARGYPHSLHDVLALTYHTPEAPSVQQFCLPLAAMLAETSERAVELLGLTDRAPQELTGWIAHWPRPWGQNGMRRCGNAGASSTWTQSLRNCWLNWSWPEHIDCPVEFPHDPPGHD